MKHRKNDHISSVAPCRNEKEGKCIFSSKMCWWNHDKVQNISKENFKCFKCSETFQSKANMMIHRKKFHAELVRKCLKYVQNECYFKNDSCWFIHAEEMDTDENEGKKEESEEVFCDVSENLKPPIRTQKKQKLD